MNNWRLKIAESDYLHLQKLVFADLPKETGAFALAGVSHCQRSSDILVRRIVGIPKQHFTLQHELRLEVSSRAINGMIALCESNNLGVVICHSHPRASTYSSSDDFGESRIVTAIRPFLSATAPTASLLLHPEGIEGRVWLPKHSRPVPISEIIVIGRHYRRIPLGHSTQRQDAIAERYDRQVRALGSEGQRLIAGSRVGVVGIGGTGSPCAEQLVRLGVQDIVLIDPDVVNQSSPSRMYGAFTSSAVRRWWHLRRSQQPKVRSLARHLQRINPEARIEAIDGNVVVHEFARWLHDRDTVFLCTDEHWGRSIVNQIAYQYLIPTLNLGVRIDSTDGRITAATGTIDILRPDNPCLWCMRFLRASRIAAESMPSTERAERLREGYVDDIDSPSPSVVSLTTTIAGLAVSAWLQLVTDFMGDAGDLARLNYAILEGTVRRGRATIDEQCLCRKVRGFGDLATVPTVPLSDAPLRS